MASQREETAVSSEDRIFNIVASGFTTLGIGLGNELGLYKAMSELDRPATAGEIAEQANCKERYVREWVLQQSMARLLEMDDTGTLFKLPEGSFEALSKVANFSGYLPRLAMSHVDLVEAFKITGPPGVPPACAMPVLKYAEKFKKTHWNQMFSHEEIVTAMETGVNILDIGCSTGDCCLSAGSEFPQSTFYGVDVVENDVLTARSKATARGLNNVHFQTCDAAKLPASWNDKFDVVMLFDTFHDIPLASQAAREIHRVLKKGGICLISENLLPSDPKEQQKFKQAPIMYSLSLYHCVPLAMNVEGSEALGNSVGTDRIKEIMTAAGLEFMSLQQTSCSYSADRKQHLYKNH